MLLLVKIPDRSYQIAKDMFNNGALKSKPMQAIANGTPIEAGDAISRKWVLNQLDTTELCLTDDWEVSRHIIEDAPSLGADNG